MFGIEKLSHLHAVIFYTISACNPATYLSTMSELQSLNNKQWGSLPKFPSSLDILNEITIETENSYSTWKYASCCITWTWSYGLVSTSNDLVGLPPRNLRYVHERKRNIFVETCQTCGVLCSHSQTSVYCVYTVKFSNEQIENVFG